MRCYYLNKTTRVDSYPFQPFFKFLIYLTSHINSPYDFTQYAMSLHRLKNLNYFLIVSQCFEFLTLDLNYHFNLISGAMNVSIHTGYTKLENKICKNPLESFTNFANAMKFYRCFCERKTDGFRRYKLLHSPVVRRIVSVRQLKDISYIKVMVSGNTFRAIYILNGSSYSIL